MVRSLVRLAWIWAERPAARAGVDGPLCARLFLFGRPPLPPTERGRARRPARTLLPLRSSVRNLVQDEVSAS